MSKYQDVIINAKDLAAGYQDHITWKEANFSVKRGEFVGVLGPNGAGKTTLFKLLLGLIKPLSGSLEIFGSAPERGNPKIGYVPQRRPVDSELRLEALEFVRLGINGTDWGFALSSKAKLEREKSMEALVSTGAETLATRSMGQLSGGELQRVFLAQALVGDPDILLLDEPLANLDIRRETELVNLVSSVSKAENVAILLIAHDINPLLKVVDRLVYVVNNRVATGTPAQIITTEMLSKLYDAPVEVLKDSRGRLAVLGTEEVGHHG